MTDIINPEVPYFGEEGLACSESTLRLLIERGVVDLPMEAVKLMTGMHGNMGRCANCGAVNGAVAALGATFGRCEAGQDNKRVFRLVEAFLSAFEARYGSVKCAQLLGQNDMAAVAQQYRCSEYVLGAAELVERLIAQERAVEG